MDNLHVRLTFNLGFIRQRVFTFFKTVKTFKSNVVINEIVNYSKIFGNDNIFILIFSYACALG